MSLIFNRTFPNILKVFEHVYPAFKFRVIFYKVKNKLYLRFKDEKLNVKIFAQ